MTGTIACCLQGAALENPAPGCTWPKATAGTAIACENSGTGAVTTGACAAGETQICQQQSDCPAGTICTAGKWKTFEVGFCLTTP
jgi:hypothetical protein